MPWSIMDAAVTSLTESGVRTSRSAAMIRSSA